MLDLRREQAKRHLPEVLLDDLLERRIAAVGDRLTLAIDLVPLTARG
jgi:hypothetical protein